MNDATPQQSDRSGVLLVAALLLGAMLTLISVGGVIALLIAITLKQESAWDDPGYVAEVVAGTAAELLVEEGFGAVPLDPGEPLLKQRTIVVAEAINERTARAVVERLLYLNEQDPEAPIDLYLTTNGGWKDSAFAIIDVMERIAAPVNTIAVGGCYSAGSMILVAGTGERSATSNTLLSIHVYPPLEDAPTDDIDPLDQQRFEELYLSRSRTPRELFSVEEESQPYFTADQAREWGVIDKVVEPRRRRVPPPRVEERPERSRAKRK